MQRAADHLQTVGNLLLVALVVTAALGLSTRLGLEVFAEQELAAVVALSCFVVFAVDLKTEYSSRILRVSNVGLATASLLSFGTIAAFYPDLIQLASSPPFWLSALATTALLLLLEATRRAAGLAMAVLLVLFFSYCILGHLLPESWNTRLLKSERVIAYLVFDTNALLGQALSIGVVVVGPFILLGESLNGTGAGAFFTRLGQLAFGRQRGGPAKASVVSSALFGMVSGSAVSNVATVGMVTIPMMRSAGYPAPLAAAIEAVGSTGGQLMPPVMGASAFLMAEYLELPYGTIMMAAICPATLYYFALFLHVDLLARRQNLRLVPPPAGGDNVLLCLRDGWTFLVPLVILAFAIIHLNWRPENAALLAVGVLYAGTMARFDASRRITVAGLRDILTRTSRSIASIVVMTGAAGLVIGCINISGLSFSATELLLGAVKGSFPLLLLAAASAAIILGLPLPTTGVYVILVPLIAPALVASGLSPLQAHFYIMYFGVMSMITPPVALSALVAANIAGAGFWRTCLECLRVGWSGYVVPVGIALSPGLLLIGDGGSAALAMARCMVGIGLLSVASAGYMVSPMGPASRIAIATSGLFLFLPPEDLPWGSITHAIAVMVCIGLCINQWLKNRQPDAA